MKRGNNNKRLLRPLNLTQSYILALSVIMLVAAFKYIATESLIQTQDSAAITINMSGKQRMLSQRIALFSLQYSTSQNESEKSLILPILETTLDEFLYNHNALVNGSEIDSIPPLNSKRIRAAYTEGDPSLNDLITEFSTNVNIIINEEKKANEEQEALKYIKSVTPYALLNKLDKAVKIRELSARDDIRKINRLQLAFLITTFIVILLEGLFIFSPMVRRINRSVAELEEQKNTIELQYKDLERFTYVASHDLQEPLRKIMSFTDRLKNELDETLNEKSQTYMNFIRSGTMRMRSMVADLHLYSSISVKPISKEPVSPEIIIMKAQQQLGIDTPDFQATVEYENLPEIQYDPEMLYYIFLELLENAYKYKGDDDLVVNIKAEQKEQEWIFCIADNGQGIAEHYHDQIFEIFQRLHRSDEKEGTGLGLAMLKKITERYHGKIWIESKIGSGAKFYFSVPVS